MRMVKKIFVILFGVILFLSCQSGKPIKRLTNEGLMYAMIYDHDNTPVNAVTVYINGRKTVTSDIQGRFIMDRMRKGEYTIKLTKKGYETLEDAFSFDPLQVLYFKMISTAQLVVLAETALENAEYNIAENYINRALLLEPNQSHILFLKSIILYLQSRYIEAIVILENLIKSGNNDTAISQLMEKIRYAQAQ
jgi:tetratricopeptide (TPR) repeat protein